MVELFLSYGLPLLGGIVTILLLRMALAPSTEKGDKLTIFERLMHLVSWVVAIPAGLFVGLVALNALNDDLSVHDFIGGVGGVADGDNQVGTKEAEIIDLTDSVSIEVSAEALGAVLPERCKSNLPERAKTPTSAEDFLQAAKCDPTLYSESRRLYLEQLAKLSPGATRDETVGMIVATFYGPGQHREGLDFLCQVYAALPSGDHRFRFQSHAFLRAIALSEGRDVSQDLARDLRSRCGRTDFTEAWSVIPLGMMERMAAGLPRIPSSQLRFGYDDEEAWQERLLESHKNGAEVPFIDHLHWARGDYEIALTSGDTDYVDFMVLAERAAYADDTDRKAYVEAFVTQFPDSALRDFVVQYAFRTDRFAIDNQYWSDQLRAYKSITPYSEINRLEDEIVSASNALLQEGRFSEALAEIEQRRPALQRLIDERVELKNDTGSQTAITSDIELNALPDGHHLKGQYDKVMRVKKSAIDALNWGNELYRLDALETDLREIYIPLSTQSAPQLYEAALEIRRSGENPQAHLAVLKLAEQKTTDPELKGKILYLMGRGFLRGGFASYDEAKSNFEKLARTLPDHDLADDALAEVGWLLKNQYKFDEAITALQRVVDRYPGRNAHDNALWLMASANEMAGRPIVAQVQYATIAKMEGEARLVKRARSVEIERGLSRFVEDLHRSARAAGFEDVSRYAIAGVTCDGALVSDEPVTAKLQALSRSSASGCAIALSRPSADVRFGIDWSDLETCQFDVDAGRIIWTGECSRSVSDPEAVAAADRLEAFLAGKLVTQTEESEWGYQNSRLVVEPGRSTPFDTPQVLLSICGVSEGWQFAEKFMDLNIGTECEALMADASNEDYYLYTDDATLACPVQIAEKAIISAGVCRETNLEKLE